MTTADGLSEVADRLYALPPADFIVARDDAVQTAKAAGDRARAATIGKLRRPTVAAWLVNLLALRRPERLDELFDLGSAMRTAQQQLRGPELRDLAARRRGIVTALVGEAVDLAVAAGAARATLPVLEVETTLTAALADKDLAHLVRTGRLLKSGQYDGFGEAWQPDLRVLEGGAAVEPARRVSTAPKPKPAPKVSPAPEVGSGAKVGSARNVAAAASKAGPASAVETQKPTESSVSDRRLAEATVEVSAAEADCVAATTAIEDRSRDVGEIEEKLTRLRRERQAAHSALLAANAASDAAEARLEQAQRRLAAAQRARERLS